MVKVSKWEWKPFSRKNVKYLPVVGQNISRWEGEGEMFPCGNGYLCPQGKGKSFPVGAANISHTHRKTFPLRLKKARKYGRFTHYFREEFMSMEMTIREKFVPFM